MRPPTTTTNELVIGAAPTAPAVPSFTSVTAGDRSVSLVWSAPASNGSPITGYQVTGTPLGQLHHHRCDFLHRDGADQRHVVHLHDGSHQQRWHQCAIGSLQRRDPPSADGQWQRAGYAGYRNGNAQRWRRELHAEPDQRLLPASQTPPRQAKPCSMGNTHSRPAGARHQ